MGCHPSRSSNSKSNKNPSNKVQHGPIVKRSIIITPEIFIGKRNGNIKEKYSLGNKLGSGAFGFVRIGMHKASGQKRAIKTIQKEFITKDMKEHTKFFNEVEILSKTDHPNIVRLYEFYEDDKFYHIVTEYITGGELFDFIIKSRMLSETIAAHFMKQILSGVAYCHSKNIVHRDLKPENLLLDNDSPDAILKIIDFGTSKIFDSKSRMTQKYGTAYYVAPEVLRKDYNEKCDIWSCGVILYILLSGKPPFYGKNDSEILEKIQRGYYNMNGKVWTRTSSQAKDLIQKMLQMNPNSRISAQEALNNEWIQNNTTNDFNASDPPLETLNNLKNFRAERKLQFAVLSFISSQLISKEESKKLAENFKALDINGDGILSKEELLEAYKSCMDVNLATTEVENIMKKVDINNSGYIDYSEFLIASSQKVQLLNKKNLESAFQMFDADNNGKISAAELKQILGNNIDSSDSTWTNLINEVDQNGDGEIDIKEFKEMMMKIVS